MWLACGDDAFSKRSARWQRSDAPITSSLPHRNKAAHCMHRARSAAAGSVKLTCTRGLPAWCVRPRRKQMSAPHRRDNSLASLHARTRCFSLLGAGRLPQPHACAARDVHSIPSHNDAPKKKAHRRPLAFGPHFCSSPRASHHTASDAQHAAPRRAPPARARVAPPRAAPVARRHHRASRHLRPRRPPPHLSHRCSHRRLRCAAACLGVAAATSLPRTPPRLPRRSGATRRRSVRATVSGTCSGR
jgi:hypothetical protein